MDINDAERTNVIGRLNDCYHHHLLRPERGAGTGIYVDDLGLFAHVESYRAWRDAGLDHESAWNRIHERIHTIAPETADTPPVASAPSAVVRIPLGQTKPLGQCAIYDDNGAFLAVGLTRMYWLWCWINDRDRFKRELDLDRDTGYDYARVLFQVGTPNDPKEWWKDRLVDQNDPRQVEGAAQMCDYARRHGFRIEATLIGKGNGMDRQAVRRPYIRRMGEMFRDQQIREGCLLAEVMNEPGVMGNITVAEIQELESVFRHEQGGTMLTATGAVWKSAETNPGDPGAEGGTSFSAEAWALQGQVGIIHLDRNQKLADGQDRPWRQPWDIGLLGRRWKDNEPIGPGSSVASERRPAVLRSMRAVAFLSRACGSIFHADEGIRGLAPLDATVPGYLDCPKAKWMLPPDIANYRMVNSHRGFPERHWTLDDPYLRSGNGNRRGILRCYGTQTRLPDGRVRQYTIPLAPVSDFALRAEVNMRVSCLQQDLHDQLWERDVTAGEMVTFSGHYHDHLVISDAM